MIRSLSGTEFLEAKQLLSSMLDDDLMLSRDWLSNPEQIVIPINAFFPSGPSVDHDAQRLLRAIHDRPVSEVLVGLMHPDRDWKTMCIGSVLLDSGVVDFNTSGAFIMPNDTESLRVIFEDILFIGGVLITDRNTSFALLHDQPAEHYVVAGPREYVEQSIGMPVDDGWKEFDESVASCIIPRDKRYFKMIGEYYRDAGKTS